MVFCHPEIKSLVCGKDGSEKLAVVGWRYKGGSWQRGQREVLTPEGANDGNPGWICLCESEENLGNFLKHLDATSLWLCQGESLLSLRAGYPRSLGEELGDGTW